MKERLKSNLGLKVLSVFLAFFVWLLVVNVSDPKQSGERTVQLEIINDDVLTDAGLTYELAEKSSVTIDYTVHMRDSSQIQASDFRAYIDLADCNVLGAVPVRLEVLNNKDRVTNVHADPSVVHVVTEPLQKKEFQLKVAVEGEAAAGYEVNGYTTSCDSVWVSGPESLVGQITAVGIEVGVDGAAEDLTGTASPVFYDANGNPLNLGERVSIDQEEIDYTVQVLKVRQLALDFEVGGNVAEGYRFTGIECDAKTISVVGLRSQLASITSVTIPSSVLNVDGLTEGKTVEVDVSQYLPEGVRMVTDTGDTTIYVQLDVEKLSSREYLVDTRDIELIGSREGYGYTFAPEEMTVTVQGLEEDLDSLSEKDIKASLDVSAVETGTHPAVITFEELEHGYEILSYTPMMLTVSDEAESAGPGENLEAGTSEEEETAETDEQTEGEKETNGKSENSDKKSDRTSSASSRNSL